MRAQFFQLFLSVSFLEYALAAPPACAAGVRCPPGGMWGEWSGVGSSTCSMDCGGCGKVFQRRPCMSNQISGCPCVGDSSRYIPCNMQTCKYPIQKTCCVPYLPMVINGTQICGPLPKTMRDEGATCCPVGGLWSDWSGYERVNSQWRRGRTCLSTSICPCNQNDAIQSISTCPCPQPTSTDAEKCTSLPNATPFYFKNLLIQHDTCHASLNMVGHNDDPTKKYCNRPVIPYPQTYRFVALLIVNNVNGGCAMDDVFNCQHGEYDDRHMNTSFTCDTNTLNWIYDYTGKQITSYIQGTYITQT